MSTAKVKQIALDNIDAEKTLQLDISTHAQGGTITTVVVDGDSANLDDDMSKLGLDGYVSAVGKTASRSVVGNVVTVELGKRDIKKSISFSVNEDNTTFVCNKMDDVIDKLTTAVSAKAPDLDIEYKGYDLLLESYYFSGKIVDAMNDIAGLVYGKVKYDGGADKYVIVGGDATYTPSGGSNITIKLVDVVSYKVVSQRDTSVGDLGSELLSLLKQIAKLKASILDIKDTESKVTASKDKVLHDQIDFSFGSKEGFQPIAEHLVIESTEWDEWSHKPEDSPYPPGQTEKSYFKVEILESYDPFNGVDKIKKRGLRTLVGANILIRLKNMPTNIRDVVGKGYTIGLSTIGMPSYSKWEKDKAIGEPHDDEYQKLYDIVIKEKKIKTVDGVFTTYSSIFVPYLKFTLDTQLQSALYGDRAKLLEQQYGVKMELMGKSSSTPLKYKGALDAHGRLISETGQVLLILATQATTLGGGGGSYFFKPVAGMDMGFITNIVTTGSGADTVSMSIDETKLKDSLIKAYDDLKAIAALGTPIAEYDKDSVTGGYPKIIREYVANGGYAGPGQPTIVGAVVGVEYETISIFNDEKEAKVSLSLSDTANSDRYKKQLTRKLKAFESRLSLMKKVIEKQTGSAPADMADLIKKISTYLILVERVKDETLTTMQTAKTEYDDAIDQVLSAYNYESKATKDVVDVTVLADSTIPAVGAKVTLPSEISAQSFTVTNVSGSGITTTITAEYEHTGT